jgi:hypothetical protein
VVTQPLAQVLPTDVVGYIHDRLDQDINPATVDRELDLISQVLTWATKTLRIPLNPSPMYGVRRPKYFNARDRRLQSFLSSEVPPGHSHSNPSCRSARL